MPILDIEIVAADSTDPSIGSPVPATKVQAGKSLPAVLAQSLANEAAQVFEAPPGTVWVKVRVIPSDHYAENGGKPEGVHPVFVTVLKSRVPEGSALENEIAGLTQAIANVLSRPVENIHIIYQPDGAGRVAFSGKLVK